MQELLNQFIQDRRGLVTEHYPWAINYAFLPEGIALDNGTYYEQNIQLKWLLFKQFEQGPEESRLNIIRYYISKWGGVRSNAAATLHLYTTMDPQELIHVRNIKGIASWSKALCVRNPGQYAIFDARVSATLNLLQLQGLNGQERRWFPRLSTRNKTITQINQLVRNAGGLYHANEVVYDTYLSLIRNTADSLNTDIHTVEMTLFSYPIELYQDFVNPQKIERKQL
jgi:hypothetical protein